MRESLIESYLVKRVKALGGEVRKVKWIGRNGAPDRLVMLPEKNPVLGNAFNNSWWVELKATGKKAEPHQLREHKRMRAMGQRVVVIDSIEGVDALVV
ncbi:VRR-NUC domain containing protein [uncultured Caudovirales phage]|uniref:VRR-NUC domain containing protein n=1 Tax=uncultured Caudovirales phage TaxID=2100421 RepID=A0A6J5T8E0_9CAUD|nr:VRR-NUC domain containing protein [uncultured Caudovirales phage]